MAVEAPNLDLSTVISSARSVAVEGLILQLEQSDRQKPREIREIQSECGLFAMYLFEKVPSTEMTSMLYAGLVAEQHRAEGAAGIVISDGEKFRQAKGFGKVDVAFQRGKRLPVNEEFETGEKGDRGVNSGIGHTRYPTAGRAELRSNIQPLNKNRKIWIGHHGNFTNAKQLQEKYKIKFSKNGPDSDTGIILDVISKAKGNDLITKFLSARKEFEGGFSMAVSDGKSMIFSRDGHGLRPGWLSAVTKNGHLVGWSYTVEDGAFKALNNESARHKGYYFDQIREIFPGETVLIDREGLKIPSLDPLDEARCIFEMLYMQHPDSTYTEGINIYEARRKSGHLLWKEAPVPLEEGETLTVMPVPDASRPAATGYYHEALKDLGERVIWEEGIMANKYFGRKFIKSEEERSAEKFFIIPSVIKGKTIALIDDSLVRGDTMHELVAKLYAAGAKKVHVRVASPPIQNPCPFGVALNDYSELLAHNHPDMEERRRFLNVTSLAYLSMEGLVEASGIPKERQCTFCFDKNGPNVDIGGVIFLDERKE